MYTTNEHPPSNMTPEEEDAYVWAAMQDYPSASGRNAKLLYTCIKYKAFSDQRMTDDQAKALEWATVQAYPTVPPRLTKKLAEYIRRQRMEIKK